MPVSVSVRTDVNASYSTPRDCRRCCGASLNRGSLIPAEARTVSDMPFDFTLDARVVDWKQRIRAFVDEVAIPREQKAFADGLDEDLRRDLQAAAKAAGIWAPQLPEELG